MRKIGWGWVPFNGGPRICLGREFTPVRGGRRANRDRTNGVDACVVFCDTVTAGLCYA